MFSRSDWAASKQTYPGVAMDTDGFLKRQELDADEICGSLATEVDSLVTQIERFSVLVVLDAELRALVRTINCT